MVKLEYRLFDGTEKIIPIYSMDGIQYARSVSLNTDTSIFVLMKHTFSSKQIQRRIVRDDGTHCSIESATIPINTPHVNFIALKRRAIIEMKKSLLELDKWNWCHPERTIKNQSHKNNIGVNA